MAEGSLCSTPASGAVLLSSRSPVGESKGDETRKGWETKQRTHFPIRSSQAQSSDRHRSLLQHRGLSLGQSPLKHYRHVSFTPLQRPLFFILLCSRQRRPRAPPLKSRRPEPRGRVQSVMEQFCSTTALESGYLHFYNSSLTSLHLPVPSSDFSTELPISELPLVSRSSPRAAICRCLATPSSLAKEPKAVLSPAQPHPHETRRLLRSSVSALRSRTPNLPGQASFLHGLSEPSRPC